MEVRLGTSGDLPDIGSILLAAPEAASWMPSPEDTLVCEVDAAVAGFVVWRRIAPDEVEILNLAVAPEFRRRGVARALLAELPRGIVFLEVRESNIAARALYFQAGFREAGFRSGYYQHPVEGAVVMRLQS